MQPFIESSFFAHDHPTETFAVHFYGWFTRLSCKAIFSTLIIYLIFCSNIYTSIDFIGQPTYGLELLADTSLVGRCKNEIKLDLSSRIDKMCQSVINEIFSP